MIKNDLSEDCEALRDSSVETKIMDTGRLFIRNLPYVCTEEDITELFKNFGTLNEVQCLIDRRSGRCKGFAIVTFMFPENALVAYKEMDGTIFKVIF